MHPVPSRRAFGEFSVHGNYRLCLHTWPSPTRPGPLVQERSWTLHGPGALRWRLAALATKKDRKASSGLLLQASCFSALTGRRSQPSGPCHYAHIVLTFRPVLSSCRPPDMARRARPSRTCLSVGALDPSALGLVSAGSPLVPTSSPKLQPFPFLLSFRAPHDIGECVLHSQICQEPVSHMSVCAPVSD